MSFVKTLLFHEVAHWLYVCQQFVDNLTGACWLKYTTSHEAEGVDELAAEFVVVHEVQEQTYHLAVLVALTIDGAGILEA